MYLIASFLGSLILGIAFLLGMMPVLRSAALKRRNYAGVELPTAAGLVFVLVMITTWLIVEVLFRYRESSIVLNNYHSGITVFSILVIGFGLFGFIDDALDASGGGGFRRHLARAFKGEITTGMLKALGGCMVALLVTAKISLYWGVSTLNVFVWLMNAALVALTANLFNLVDLRPGRAIKVFIPLAALTVGLTIRYEILSVAPGIEVRPIQVFVAPILCVVAVALVLFPGDLREKFMVGDAGSNVLGATVGLGLVLGTPPWWRLGVLISVIALTILSEKYSFSAAIERNRVLNYLDMLGRKSVEGEPGRGSNNS